MTDTLRAAEQTSSSAVGFADEMRLGLHSQIRRVWFSKGVKLRQRQEMRFVWRWLYLVVEAGSGRLFWTWRENMKQESMQSALADYRKAGVEAVVWDNAPSHRAKVLREPLPDPLPEPPPPPLPKICFLPPYSPELNPAERVFEEVRRHVEGKVWESIEAKMAAAEAYLTNLAADGERVKRLAGWQWIQESLQNRPTTQLSQVTTS